MQWNDADRCAEFSIEELPVCLFGAQDILIDCTFRCWAMNNRHIEVQIGSAKAFPLDANSPAQAYIRNLAVAELLTSGRYVDQVADADEMIDRNDQRQYRLDVGYGHSQHERA